MNELDRIFSRSEGASDYARGYLGYLAEVLGRLDVEAIAALVHLLLDARDRGARIFVCGNGGSAATSDHFANDLSIGTRSPERPFRASSLASNMAVLTAIANDDGYDQVFVQQLQTQMQPGDVVLAISASGNSPNVVEALEYAGANGARTAALTGFDGGRLRAIAEVCVHVPTAKGEYGPVEDVHMVLDHLVSSYLCRAVSEADARARGARSTAVDP